MAWDSNGSGLNWVGTKMGLDSNGPDSISQDSIGSGLKWWDSIGRDSFGMTPSLAIAFFSRQWNDVVFGHILAILL